MFVLTLVWGTLNFLSFFVVFLWIFFCFRFCSRQFLISMMGNVKFPNHKKILNFTFHSFLKKQSKLSHLGFLNWRLGGQNGEGCCKNYIKGTEIFSGEWHKKLKKNHQSFLFCTLHFCQLVNRDIGRGIFWYKNLKF